MPTMSRLSLYGIASTTLFVYTVLHAFRERSNFYSAAVYLSKSNACTMILWNQGIYQTVLFGKLLQAIFFGELRMIEVERLQERGWFAVTETLLALTIFKDEFDSSFVLLFVSLLFLKIFHWLAADRIELMEQAASTPTSFHLRIVSLLSWLWVLDAVFLTFAVESILIDGPTVMIMFASEYMILLAMVWSSTMKYGLNVIDLRSEVPWDDKSIYVFYVDLTTDFFKLVTYVSFFGLILTFYGLPLNILRDVYLTFRSFILKCRDLRRYRQATRNMDSLYPNATADELTAMTDKMCIICREDMEVPDSPRQTAVASTTTGNNPAPAVEQPPPMPAAVQRGPNETPKKLPCGHVFHFHCLRSWLERQQSCPTCRRSVLGNDPVPPTAAAGAVPVPAGARPADAEEAIRQAQLNLARNLGREAFGVVFPGLPFPAAAEEPAVPNPGPTPTQINPDIATGGPIVGGTPGAAPTGAQGNPLARFSLPDHPLPPAGEASLFHAPVHSPLASPPLSGYGVGYGPYLANLQARGTPGPPSQAQATRVPNLEERLAHIRSRMVSPAASTSTAASAASIPTPTSASTSPPSALAAESTTEGDGAGSPASANTEEASQTSRRAIALAAAERRAAAARTNGLPRPTSFGEAPLSTPPSGSGITSPRPPGLGAPSSSSASGNPSPASSTAVPPTPDSSSPASSFHQPPRPSSYPRLIPLFDPSNAQASNAYPHLFSSLPTSNLAPGPSDGVARPLNMQPLVPERMSEAQLQELGDLTRDSLEGRLRVLVEFQDRMSELARDMGQVLAMLPASTTTNSATEGNLAAPSVVAEKLGEEVSRNVEKGKAPAEGVNARQADPEVARIKASGDL